MIRCKFRLNSLEPTEVADAGEKLARFEASYDSTVPEDQQFSRFTPSGHLEARINNPAALAQLKVGQSYYLDISPCE